MELKCSPDIAQDLTLKMLTFTLMMFVLSLMVGLLSTILCCQCKKMALPLTHLNVNQLSKKQTGLVLAYTMRFKTLEKFDAIIHMDCPCNATELCMFIGCMNYNHDMWPNCAQILKPLMDQSSLKKKAPINRTDQMQKAFNKMHLLIAADALTAYPNHNKRFDIYTYASNFQLGAYIMQEGRLVAFFSYKLTKSQQNYTTIE
jgi:hypothetical protein